MHCSNVSVKKVKLKKDLLITVDLIILCWIGIVKLMSFKPVDKPIHLRPVAAAIGIRFLQTEYSHVT